MKPRFERVWALFIRNLSISVNYIELIIFPNHIIESCKHLLIYKFLDTTMSLSVRIYSLLFCLFALVSLNGCIMTEPMIIPDNQQSGIVTERYESPTKNTEIHLYDKVSIILKTGEYYNGEVVKVDDYNKEEAYDFYLKTEKNRLALNFEQIESIEITREVHYVESQYFLATFLCGIGTCGVVYVLGAALVVTLAKGMIWN